MRFYCWSTAESPVTDIERAIRVEVKQIRRGLDARFFGNRLTHEQRIAVIPMAEWEQIMSGIQQKLSKYRLLNRPLDYVCDYTKSRFDTTIHAVQIDNNSGQLVCEFKGKTKVSTVLEIYTDKESEINVECCKVPSFSGHENVTH